MIVILNGLLASGKTFLCKKLKEKYRIIDENEKEIQEALSLHENMVDLERAFCYLQINKLQRLVEAFKKEPNKPIIYVSSIFYTTQIYWNIPEKRETLESALVLNREVRGIRHIEQTLLSLMGQYYEVRIDPDVETILTQFKTRKRPNEICPNASYIQSLKELEKKVPPLIRHTTLKSSNISVLDFTQIIKISDNKILSPGLISMTFEQYENFYSESELIKIHCEILRNLLRLWDNMNVQDLIGRIIPALPVILIKDIKTLEKIFISLICVHAGTHNRNINILAPYGSQCEFSVDIVKLFNQDYLFIFDSILPVEVTERLFEEISNIRGTEIKLVHVLFEGGHFSATKSLPTVTVRIKDISVLQKYQYEFLNRTWDIKE